MQLVTYLTVAIQFAEATLKIATTIAKTTVKKKLLERQLLQYMVADATTANLRVNVALLQTIFLSNFFLNFNCW